MNNYDPEIHKKNLEAIKQIMDKITDNPNKIKVDDLIQATNNLYKNDTDSVTDQ